MGLLPGYLYRYPDAKDTAEGIAPRWFRANGANVREAAVEAAFQELVTNGWLAAIESRVALGSTA